MLTCGNLNRFENRSITVPQPEPEPEPEPENSDEDEVQVKLIIPIPGDMDVRRAPQYPVTNNPYLDPAISPCYYH